MFLTGFDATTLNTLWVDKNLRQHGLIQAYSRTNRILNSVKTYGNIVCFRDLEDETNDALALFGNKDAARASCCSSPYAEYYDEYASSVAELLERFPLGEPIVGEAAQKEFIAPLRRDPAAAQHPDVRSTTSPATRSSPTASFQDYRSIYLDLYAGVPRASETPRRSRSTTTSSSRSS